MGNWYDEDMPGQIDPWARGYDEMIRNYQEGKNADGSEYTPTVDPEIGSRWKHYNGIEYTVLHIANIGGSKNYKETVVYQGNNGKVWTRELEDWYRSFSAVV